jgi:phage host-nuclease inhibitor protein Gam
LPATPARSFDDAGSLIQKIGVTSTAEVEKLIGELQQARSYLEFEGERIQRKAVRYAELSQAASSSLKVISESVAEWCKAGHSVRNTHDGTAGPAQWLLLTASSDCEA